LDESIKPAETTPNLYRLRMAVGAHATEKLVVRERGPESTTVVLTADSDQSNYLLDLVKRVPDALEKLKPLMDAQGALVELDQQIEALQAEEQTATEDEARDRDNLTALKGSDAAKRFVDELNHAEDKLQATRKQTADLQKQRQAAVEKLNEQISEISFDWDVTKK
jgi:predicted  nucleic acid-binding Zn-ribbon protein